MPKLIKNGQLLQDDWRVVARDEPFDVTAAGSGQWLLPYSVWQRHKDELAGRDNVSFWLDGEDTLAGLSAASVALLPVIAINFPVFTDGRGFSLARQLREQLDFKGELRAIGNFIQDQVFYLKRCGFDAYVVGDEIELDAFLTSLKDFSNSYQAAVDEPQPLFRRRM